MAVPTASVRDANRYRTPAVTGLTDLLDRHVRNRPRARALVVTGDRIQLSYHALATLVDDVAARLGRHRAAPRRRDRARLRQHRRVRRRAPGVGTGRAGGRSDGPHAARVTDVRTARGGWGHRRCSSVRHRATPGRSPRPTSRHGVCDCASPLPGRQRPCSTPAHVWCDRSGAGATSSRPTTPSSCSPREPATRPRWSR